MSDKCSHNNHTHFLLWFFVFGLCMNSCVDCSGQETRTKNAIVSLNNSVYQLQNENSLLKGKVHELEDKLQAESNRNISIDNDLDYLKREVQSLREKQGSHK